MAFFLTALRENPELAIFLTLAAGFTLGRIRIGSFRLGNVMGTLVAGVLIGQLDIQVPPIIKIFFFALFLFRHGLYGGSAVRSRARTERTPTGSADVRPLFRYCRYYAPRRKNAWI